jgi:hypothetical protein
MACSYPSDGVVVRILTRAHPATPIPLLRTQLYYLVCIVLRLALANLVWVLRKEKGTMVVVGACALLSMAHLSQTAFQPHPHRWWSQQFQFYLSSLVVLACAATYTRHLPTWVVPTLLYTSIVGGLVQRWRYCWKKNY